jgi:hypothetical protein
MNQQQEQQEQQKQQQKQDMTNNGNQIHNVSSEIDIVEKRKEEQQRRNELLKEKMEVRRKQQIQFIMTQTNYDEIEATEKLEACNNDVMKVVGEYLGIAPKKDENANKTKNQKVFSVIRDIMDAGSRNFIMQQEKAKKIEEIKKAMEKRNQQNEQNETLELSKDDNAVKIMKEKID